MAASASRGAMSYLLNILKCLKDEGYKVVFIEDLILKENYEIKHDGTQCKLKDGAN